MDHYNGTGVPVSYERATELLTRAAEMGHVGAQHNLGSMYSEGRGVPQSDGEAVEWYRRAADQGHADAQNGLNETSKNDEKGRKGFIRRKFKS